MSNRDIIMPRLSDLDRSVWAEWESLWRSWARSHVHRRRVAQAREHIAALLATPGLYPYIGLSGGKDSVCVAHLAASAGILDTVSERDDLDYPGTEEIVQAVSDRLGLKVTILRPPVSLWEALKSMNIPLDSDVHGSIGTISTEHFYQALLKVRIERCWNAAVLGLTTHESDGRRMNRATHGITYLRKDGMTICQPIADWRPNDIYAYLLTHDLPIHPVYRCIGVRPYEPWRIRSGWPIHRTGAGHGHYTWLARYWPDVFARVAEIWPEVHAFI